MESTTSKKSLLKKLEVPHEKDAVYELTPWINRDIVPLPPSRRTWGPWSFVGFWLVTGINISGWTSASALLALGLNVWQAMLTVIIGNIIVGFAVALNGLPGGEWHIGFPIINRYVWGLYGSFFPLLMRILLSFVWYGAQTWFGGQSIKVVIGAIWPSFLTMKNTLPEGTAMETNDCIAVILFWVLSLPLLAVPPELYKVPFRYATASITIAAFALFIWALAKQGGGGPLLSDPSTFLGIDKVPKGKELGWVMVLGVTTNVGSISAGIMNQSDYSRFARKPGDQVLSQIICVPIMSILTALVGIICTSCAAGFFPDEELLWEPYKLLIAIQTHGGPGARAAVFFAGCAFVVSQWGINISGNGVSGGIDLSGVFPKYINIRRGAFITACVGLAINPWQLLNTANRFITVLSSFAVFLGPATGLMITDYVVVRRRKVRLSHLYMPTQESIYWNTYGINFRAVFAWINGVWPLMPGFIAAVQNKTTSEGWTHMYYLSWLAGFFISGTTYIILCKIWPLEGLGEVDDKDVFGTFTEITKGDSTSYGSGESGENVIASQMVAPVLGRKAGVEDGEDKSSWKGKF
ncbi:NCS1 nucleoside transporter family [Dendrothele bispora CBS 962.96]|uniref:NCS1 nucleoside transporter family n=1 Tax=Dendrothele bispora (strain CBS 962.96) TaxID=1314807 RepID=A0A4S8MCC9_DENBC|nr:NCS1 nucleoside transporter family [Dendrothele bispora CBS 962.96]